MNLAELDDRALVTRFLSRRDERSFRELYRRHAPLVWRVARRVLAGVGQNTGAAEDATQECWLRAVRALPTFEWRSSLSTWLVGIVLKVCAEARRAPATIHELDEAADSALPPALDDAELERVDLERVLAALAPGYRAAVVLHDLEGFTHEEIAAALGVAPGTAKSQLARGRRALRDALGSGSNGDARNEAYR